MLTGGVFCFLQLHHKSCVAVGVLHLMLKREFPFKCLQSEHPLGGFRQESGIWQDCYFATRGKVEFSGVRCC